MKTIESELREEKQQLEKLIADASKRLDKAPSGNLRIMEKRGCVEYYLKNDDGNNTNKNGRYMKKSERELAKAIAQRDYDASVVKNAKERVKAIDIFLNKYSKTSMKDIYQKMHPLRRKLISAWMFSDEEYVKKWQSVEYVGKPFENNSPEIITEKGERVRSKTEKIIADKLYALGIPYRYEYPILLKGNIKIYPGVNLFFYI